MRTISNAVTSSLLLAVLAPVLTGCGDADSSSPATSASTGIGHAVALESPAIATTHAIARDYTCEGRDISPPLQWGDVPAGTRELALLLLSLEPVRTNGTRVVEKVAAQWAVAGLAPTLHGLAPGKLPRGALLGRNAHGSSSYSICPARGESRIYLIALFLLPHRLSAPAGFSDEALFTRLSHAHIPFGELFANYTRA
jgi:phosphatidylethanolamine-binding protein (PEBP) family uncharacterized protein